MLGRLRAGVLDVSEDPPIRQRAGPPERIPPLGRAPDLARAQAGDGARRRNTVDSVGVDAWGCDYALVGEQGVLLQNPYHYRDKRTDGIMEAVFERVHRR